VDDDVFLANAENDSTFHLNEIGAALWRLLERPTSVEEATAVLREAFPEVERDRIQAHVAALVAELAAHGLVTSCR
jgi:hypothetical protein